MSKRITATHTENRQYTVETPIEEDGTRPQADKDGSLKRLLEAMLGMFRRFFSVLGLSVGVGGPALRPSEHPPGDKQAATAQVTRQNKYMREGAAESPWRREAQKDQSGKQVLKSDEEKAVEWPTGEADLQDRMAEDPWEHQEVGAVIEEQSDEENIDSVVDGPLPWDVPQRESSRSGNTVEQADIDYGPEPHSVGTPENVEFSCAGSQDNLAVRHDKGPVMCRQGAIHLRYAARLGYAELIHLLVKKGVPVNETTSGGMTALHAAAERGHVQGVRILLQYGADPGIHDEAGRTALDVAANDEIRQLLEKRTEVDVEDEHDPRAGYM